MADLNQLFANFKFKNAIESDLEKYIRYRSDIGIIKINQYSLPNQKSSSKKTIKGTVIIEMNRRERIKYENSNFHNIVFKEKNGDKEFIIYKIISKNEKLEKFVELIGNHNLIEYDDQQMIDSNIKSFIERDIFFDSRNSYFEYNFEKKIIEPSSNFIDAPCKIIDLDFENIEFPFNSIFLGNWIPSYLIDGKRLFYKYWPKKSKAQFKYITVDKYKEEIRINFESKDSNYHLIIKFNHIKFSDCLIYDRYLYIQLIYPPQIFKKKDEMNQKHRCFNFFETKLANYVLVKPVLTMQFESNDNYLFEKMQPIFLKRGAKRIRENISITTDYPIDFSYTLLKQFKFSIQYMLLCLISNGLYSIFEINKKFAHKILTDYQDQANQEKLEEVLENMKYENNEEASNAYENCKENFVPTRVKENSNYIYTRKVNLTHSYPIYCFPTYDKTNRVIRQFHANRDRFMRMKLTEDDGKELIEFSDSTELEKMMNKGIEVGCFQFVFLAHSNSQMRTKSCWIICESKPTFTADNVRKWIGNVNEKIIIKYTSRLGQGFTATVSGIEIHPNSVIRIEDIKKSVEKKVRIIDKKGEREEIRKIEYTFSDGVGTISLKLADRLIQSLKEQKIINSNNERPCTFQCRFQGAKGVFSIDPRIDYSLEIINVRPSQRKFESSHLKLEIVDYSKFHYGYLNRQYILLLNSLGIEDQVFLKIFDEYIAELTDTNQKKDNTKNNFMININNNLKDMFNHLFEIRGTEDPLIHQIVVSYVSCCARELKEKCRIKVKNSAHLLGILDEFGILEYGEVFCRISISNDPNDNENKTIEGEVIVVKSPCLFPGDVLKLKAINNEKLNHYINVVVFPQKGPRPHPNETSGSDLDGDQYFISWDQSLIYSKENKPEEFDLGKSQTESIEINSQAMVKAFCNNCQRNMLGKIANTHLAIADSNKFGLKAFDKRCIRLGYEHSKEVDFPKTGIPGEIPKECSLGYNKIKYPHFMNKPPHRTRKSLSILGILYDKVNTEEIIKSTTESINNTLIDKSLVIPGHELYLKDVDELYRKYCHKTTFLLKKTRIKTEGELMSGFINENETFFDDKHDKDIEIEKILQEFSGITKEIKDDYEKLISKTGHRFLVAVSSYVCAYQAFSENSKNLIGFPWIVAHKELYEIKKGQEKINF